MQNLIKYFKYSKCIEWKRKPSKSLVKIVKLKINIENRRLVAALQV